MTPGEWTWKNPPPIYREYFKYSALLFLLARLVLQTAFWSAWSMHQCSAMHHMTYSEQNFTRYKADQHHTIIFPPLNPIRARCALPVKGHLYSFNLEAIIYEIILERLGYLQMDSVREGLISPVIPTPRTKNKQRRYQSRISLSVIKIKILHEKWRHFLRQNKCANMVVDIRFPVSFGC